MITFPKLWLMTGPARKMSKPLKRTDLMPKDVADAPSDDQRWFIALVSPNVPWLKLSARHPTSDKEYVFRPESKMVSRLFGVTGPVLARHLCAMINKDTVVTMMAEVDTNHPEFAKLAPGPHSVEVLLRSATLINKVAKTGERRFEVVIESILRRQEYDGYVALDLGNTSSALVRQDGPASHDPETHLIDVESPYDNPDPAPAPSALCIQGYTPAPAGSAEYANATWEIGKTAMQSDPAPESLLFGAKRLLREQTRRDDDGMVSVMLGNRWQQLPRSEPAELYIAKMFQAFVARLKCYPARLALTCPTTFSRSEVEELKLAVYHAWRRALGETTRQKPTPQELKASVWDVIDEASAAAFYFVYKDFLRREVPGRIPGFRYVYPQGMTLLLYDCGGGTTDMALVRATAPENRRVQFDVLGRAGHRSFGGDAMTMAVYRVLKARLAQLRRPNLNLGSGAALGKALSDPAKLREIDQLVPTAFGGERDDDRSEEQRLETHRRRERTLTLWRIAEAMKYKLAEAADASKKVSIRDAMINQADVSQLLADLSLTNESRAALEKIDLCRNDVDPMLLEDVRATVRYARNLIQNRLEPSREIDWVYVVGNASCYPLVAETLRDPVHGLPIRFLQQRMMPVEPKDLKNSVAKGALTALRVSKLADFQFSAEFDAGLMDRLCFDIKRSGLDAVADRKLFRENTPHDQLGSKLIEITKKTQDSSDATELTISRAWPGDPVDEPYLYFKSHEPMSGTYAISYDPDPELDNKRRFVLRKTQDGQPSGDPIVGYSAEAGLRNSPVQLGENLWPAVRVPKDLK